MSFKLCLFFLFALISAPFSVFAEDIAETSWEDLIPSSWKPELIFEELDLGSISDEDPRADAVLQSFVEKWADAPVNPDMNNRRITISGFVAPLDWEQDGALKTFLLVPYFGACIHVPPPPANQIIYIELDKAAFDVRTMDTVRIQGLLVVEKHESDSMGRAGYKLIAEKLEKI